MIDMSKIMGNCSMPVPQERLFLNHLLAEIQKMPDMEITQDLDYWDHDPRMEMAVVNKVLNNDNLGFLITYDTQFQTIEINYEEYSTVIEDLYDLKSFIKRFI